MSAVTAGAPGRGSHPRRQGHRLAKLPFNQFALNELWVEIVMLADDLIDWTQALLLDGELQKAKPKRLRYRLLHISARLAFSGRGGKLHLQTTWP